MNGEAWFRPKRFGYGATPTNWKGWAFIAGTVALAAALAVLLLPNERVAFVLAVLVLVAIVTVVSRAKSSDPWRWQWGGRGSGDR